MASVTRSASVTIFASILDDMRHPTTRRLNQSPNTVRHSHYRRGMPSVFLSAFQPVLHLQSRDLQKLSNISSYNGQVKRPRMGGRLT